MDVGSRVGLIHLMTLNSRPVAVEVLDRLLFSYLVCGTDYLVCGTDYFWVRESPVEKTTAETTDTTNKNSMHLIISSPIRGWAGNN